MAVRAEAVAGGEVGDVDDGCFCANEEVVERVRRRDGEGERTAAGPVEQVRGRRIVRAAVCVDVFHATGELPVRREHVVG